MPDFPLLNGMAQSFNEHYVPDRIHKLDEYYMSKSEENRDIKIRLFGKISFKNQIKFAAKFMTELIKSAKLPIKMDSGDNCTISF
jgi:hypothetical protein